MAAQLNDTVGIYPQQYEEKKMEERIQAILKERFGRDLDNCTKSEIFEALMVITKQEMAGRKRNTGSKKLYYISAEFLIGKLLSNNLINLGMYEEVEKALAAHGRELTEIEEMEMEPSLGNGGLGRLAACFLDSIATLGLPGDGIGLNYHFGLFRQLLVDHKQKEVKNPWITNESWLVRQPVSFAVPYKNFTMHSTLYDIDVPGYNNGCNRLHLFDVDTVDESIVPSDSINFDKHQIQKNLTLFLYPDDSDRAGQLLRIYQQYFMVSNGAQFILMECEQKGYDLHKLYDHVVIQINDTHPSMVIPELIRLLQERGFTMQEAIDVVSKTCAYTNHTILAEALEKWPIDYLEEVVPHLMPIIHELDAQAKKKYKDEKVAIIDKDQRVHMAHMDIHYGFSVNGVAALHTEILKNSELKPFYDIYPEKFNNKTNGITFRRWLLHCNRELAQYIESLIGPGFKKDADELEKLLKYKDNKKVLAKLEEIKHNRKLDLKQFLYETQNIALDENSIIDVQVKRLHEYKRQLLNILHVMYLYNEIKEHPDMEFVPRTFIFGAKAAAGYKNAKLTIKLINSVAEVINNDKSINNKIKVVFIEDYKVSNAEWIFAAADVSEQISTASKEASGTGNMKFMLNGALTLGTMDGANVEMYEEVGPDNMFIFGMSSDEVIAHEHNRDYDPMQIFNTDQDIRKVLTQLVNGFYSPNDSELFRDLYNSLLNTHSTQYADTYFILADFRSYAEAQKKIMEYYKNRSAWAKSAILNTAHSGKFSSDRTIQEYVDDIWHLPKVKVDVE